MTGVKFLVAVLLLTGLCGTTARAGETLKPPSAPAPKPGDRRNDWRRQAFWPAGLKLERTEVDSRMAAADGPIVYRALLRVLAGDSYRFTFENKGEDGEAFEIRKLRLIASAGKSATARSVQVSPDDTVWKTYTHGVVPTNLNDSIEVTWSHNPGGEGIPGGWALTNVQATASAAPGAATRAARPAVPQAPPPQSGFVAHDMRRLDRTVYFHRLAQVPPYVSRAVPKNGVTTFYGYRAMPVAGKPPVVFRIHCYQWSTTGLPIPAPRVILEAGGRKRKEPQVKDKEVMSAAGLYVQSKPGAAFRLAATVNFDDGNGTPDGGGMLTFVEPMWLDPGTRTIPMVRFCCHHWNGFYGPYGWNSFAVFDAGPDSAPALQKFEHSSSHFDFIDWNFDARDARGRRQFIQLIDPLGEGPDTYVRWTWNPTARAFEKPVPRPNPPTDH